MTNRASYFTGNRVERLETNKTIIQLLIPHCSSLSIKLLDISTWKLAKKEQIRPQLRTK